METRSVSLRERLHDLASNLWWSWQPDLPDLFRELSPARWHELRHNPTALLAEIDDETLDRTIRDRRLRERIDDAWRRLQGYLRSDETWGATHAGMLRPAPVAYFSAEFGVHEALAMYSGGLGLLAGDHLKSASDLGVPLVGVGLFYREGYFAQQIDVHGWQRESYPPNDPEQLPMHLARNAKGEPVTVAVQTRHGDIRARVWRVEVGRVPLLLLDADFEENNHEDRLLTRHLYGGDARVRIRQELLLGVGGTRALRALGMRPGVLHLNEGHSAFAVLEMARRRMQTERIEFAEATRRVAARTVFTTHTPVPAGHDRFPPELIDEHLGPIRDEIGLPPEDLLALGREDPGNGDEPFCMTVLALRVSERTNGVSSLHGRVSRQMWANMWPDRPEHEVPIGHVTNGVHLPTWIAPSMNGLFERYLPLDWFRRQAEPGAWADIEQADDAELWDVHQGLKDDLIDYVRRKASAEAERRDEDAHVVDALWWALGVDTLLIGFARRFATYKRATLLLNDLDALDALVNHPERPVTFVFGGKAHPHDDGGKHLMQRIHQVGRDPRFLGKVIFLENYEIDVARHLVQGVDVWLNNPRRPKEASGTSGQKVALNGGLNCSLLDGWWAEAYDGTNGFVIGDDSVHRDEAVQDRHDGEHAMRALRDEVAPTYYARDEHGLPRAWIARMKRSIRTLAWRFNADRMVRDYARGGYLPAGGGSYIDVR
jgi:starch phosphorylase